MEKSEDRIFIGGFVRIADFRRLHRGNGRSKSYLRHSIPPTSLFLSFLFTVSSFLAALVLFHLKLVPFRLLLSYLVFPFPPPLLLHLPFLSSLARLPNFGRSFIRSSFVFTRFTLFFSFFFFL